MGMIGNVIRISEEELNSMLKDSGLLEDKIYNEDTFNAKWFLDLDKTWDGINYILTGKSSEEYDENPNTLERAFFSCQFIDEDQDLGNGPAHYLTPIQVKETYAQLEKFSLQDIKGRIKGQKMNELGIYPEIWEDSESQEYLIESYNSFKEFYKIASRNKEAIVTFIA